MMQKKLLIAGTALAIAFAGPAFAQGRGPDASGNAGANAGANAGGVGVGADVRGGNSANAPGRIETPANDIAPGSDARSSTPSSSSSSMPSSSASGMANASVSASDLTVGKTIENTSGQTVGTISKVQMDASGNPDKIFINVTNASGTQQRVLPARVINLRNGKIVTDMSTGELNRMPAE
jgi:hypothetical protein